MQSKALASPDGSTRAFKGVVTLLGELNDSFTVMPIARRAPLETCYQNEGGEGITESLRRSRGEVFTNLNSRLQRILTDTYAVPPLNLQY